MQFLGASIGAAQGGEIGPVEADFLASEEEKTVTAVKEGSLRLDIIAIAIVVCVLDELKQEMA